MLDGHRPEEVGWTRRSLWQGPSAVTSAFHVASGIVVTRAASRTLKDRMAQTAKRTGRTVRGWRPWRAAAGRSEEEGWMVPSSRQTQLNVDTGYSMNSAEENASKGGERVRPRERTYPDSKCAFARRSRFFWVVPRDRARSSCVWVFFFAHVLRRT